MLSVEQEKVFKLYQSSENILITGSAGTGKSFIIQKIVNDARNRLKLSEKELVVTAMTGCAAVLLNCKATTLHAWSHIGIANKPNYKILNNIKKNAIALENWKTVKLLIIDEISMMSKHILELLHFIATHIRNNQKCFGGIQVIFVGDFFQLPPIGNKLFISSNQFCFESKLWTSLFPHQFLFKQNFRQKTGAYQTILEEIRYGKLSKTSFDILRERIGKQPDKKNKVQPVILHSKKQNVHNINLTYLNELSSPIHTFKASIQNEIKDKDNYTKKDIHNFVKNIYNSSQLQETLNLKIGAQVMCTRNIDLQSNICNGTTGVIVNFTIDKHPIVKFNNNKTFTFKPFLWESNDVKGLFIKQYPLILAWSITIHKSQGTTLDMAYIDVGNSIFLPGQLYVALSRVKSLDGLFLISFKSSKVYANQKVLQFIYNLEKKMN